MNVGTVCTRPPIIAAASATLSEIAVLMHERHVGTVVITKSPLDAPVAIGLVTDRDILRAQLAHTADFSRLSAAQVMSTDPLVLNESCEIEEAILALRARGVRRAPVVSATGSLVGVVSCDDLVAHVAENLMTLASTLSRSVHARAS
jgi:CBS domain-containing protein